MIYQTIRSIKVRSSRAIVLRVHRIAAASNPADCCISNSNYALFETHRSLVEPVLKNIGKHDVWQ